MLEGVHLRWTRASRGYKVVIPSVDAGSYENLVAINKADNKIVAGAKQKIELARFLKRAGIAKDYIPTEAEQKRLDKATLVLGRGTEIPMPRTRFVPVGEPVVYNMTVAKAEEALLFLRESYPWQWVEFYSRYGSPFVSAPRFKDDSGFGISLERWRDGDEDYQITELQMGMNSAVRRTKRGNAWLENAFDVSNVGNFRLRVFKPGPDRPLAMRFEPQAFSSMLWFVLAKTLTGDTNIKACCQCGKPMVLSRGLGNRSNKVTCSDACRMARSRAKRSKTA